MKTKKEKNKKRLRILMNTNAIWSPSGYAQQAKQILPRMRDAGYSVGVINFYGHEGGRFELDGIMQYPRMGDIWGSDAMPNHEKHFNADIVFTLQDIWTLDINGLKAIKRWIPILPIDHSPVPPPIVERARLAYRIVTYSEFGKEELRKDGLFSTYIQHTVETKLFKKGHKHEMRKKLGIPTDVMLFGMVAANKDNPPRKSFQQVMDAFKRFHTEHPKSALYLHTLLSTDKGFPINEYAKYLGINKAIYNTEPYDFLYNIPQDAMYELYATFDCLLNPSTNEGFGVPIIEAQACEVPVIVNDSTAMPELMLDGISGFKTKVMWRRFTPLLAYVDFPSTESIYDCMETMFKSDREKMGKAGRKYVLEHYDADKVFKDKWIPFLEKLEKEVYDTPKKK